MKKVALLIIVFLVILVVIGIIASVISLLQEKSEERILTKDWIYYEHDVLGISFHYPPEWGEPITSPRTTITNLEKINELRKEGRENTDYVSELDYRVDLYFSGEKVPRIEIYNDEFKGKLPSNLRLMSLGPIDNFLEIKESHDICDYRFEFDKRPNVDWYVLEEIYSECRKDIKTSIRQTRVKREGGDTYYNYNLTDYAFVKLQNNYFDNAVISYFHAGKQSFDEILGPEDIFMEAGESYEKEKAKFSAFVGSIDVFPPTISEQKDFEVIEGEDPRITTIRKYYYKIVKGDLEDAYGMYKEGDIDFETYESWYEETILAEPSDFEEIGDNRYRFKVYFQDENREKELYHVTMEVEEEKIIPISSEKILTEFFQFEDMIAFTKERQGNSYLVVLEDGEEKVLDEGVAEFSFERGDKKMLLGPLKFSPKGNYLMSYFSFFGFGGIDIYNLNEKEKVLSLDLAHFNNSAFTEEEDYFFACVSNEMYGQCYEAIYSVSDFEEVYRKEEDMCAQKCSYDKERRVIRFEKGSYFPAEEKIIEFSLEDKEAREVAE